MQNPRAKGLSRFISAALVLAMVLAALPPFELPVFAAVEETYSSGAVYLDADDSGKTIYIKQGVFSVTVNGAKDIELIFGERTADGATGVTMNRRSVTNDLDDANGDTIENLYYVSQQLGQTGKAQTCPLMITGNATVRATFHGKCRFYAGTNACTVNNQNKYTAQTQYNGSNGNGFAGIQVNSGSTLIIEGADDLKVFGGHQFAIPGDDGKVTINGKTINYGDMLRANNNVGNHTDPYNNATSAAPSNATDNSRSGGAGIGGGPTLKTEGTDTKDFTNGSPGTIIINGGNIEAFGGHQSAGIGGAINSPATTGMIQINGGNVIAHGGRWAAGIGDGDTVNGKTPNTFINASTLIEINGGTVEAYGGVASPGIGAADEVSHKNGHGTDAIRQLQINLNGGTIRAYSGFPSGYSNAATISKAPAAIGVGVDTNAPANSLYVSSEADLRCAGFGHYALSENGVTPTVVPTIAVDSDGYLLLLQFNNYYSNEERVIKVYEPQKILKQVDLDNNNVLDDAEVEVTIFTGHTTKNGQDVIEKFYIYTTEDDEGKVQQYIFNEAGKHATDVNHLTLYVDENSKEITDLRITFPYYFRSVALTLPEPDLYGGIYALEVPTNGIPNATVPDDGKPIILTIDAREQGTQSGTIFYPSNNNLDLKPLSAPLIDLDVFGNVSTQGLIGDSFMGRVYGYTVYAEPGDTEVDLYVKIGTASGESYDVTFLNTNDTWQVTGDGSTWEYTWKNIQLTEKETVLRIKKQDKISGTDPDAISYKITIIKKEDYTLALSKPSKVYDGQPAEVTATGVGIAQPDIGEKVDILHQEIRPLPATTTETNTIAPQSFSQNNIYIRNNYYISLSYTVEIVQDSAYIYYFLKIEPRQRYNTNNEITNMDTKYAAGWRVSKSDYGNPTRLTSPPSVFTGNGYDWITADETDWRGNSLGYAQRTIAYGNYRYIYLRVNNTSAYLVNSNNSNTSLGNIIEISAPTAVNEPFNNKAVKEQAAYDAVDNGEKGGKFEYDVYTTTTHKQVVAIRTFSIANSSTTSKLVEAPAYILDTTKTYSDKGYYEIVHTPGTPQDPIPVVVPEEDLKKVSYTYYQTHDELGNKLAIDKNLGNNAPKDAGTYYVEATLVALTYNAAGHTTFVISQRPLKVLRIENWLLYVSAAPAGDTLPITTPGYIELDDIVPADNDGKKVKFVPESVYYDDPDSTGLAVDYKADKIVLANGVLQGDEAHNYFLDYADPKHIRVYGQIAYRIEGAIFRMSNTPDAKWRKYYPVDGDIPVGAAGNPADYHSPAYDSVYLAHAEYIRARTVNAGEDEARYCIDIEYGAMSFGFYRSYWDVEGLDYHELKTSTWSGMDGSNNKLTIINRSNRAITYTLSLKRASGVSGAKIGFEIKTENVKTGGTVLVGITDDKVSEATGSAITVGAATAGANPGIKGTAATDSCYLIMSGVPQFAEGVATTTGTISIAFGAGTP